VRSDTRLPCGRAGSRATSTLGFICDYNHFPTTAPPRSRSLRSWQDSAMTTGGDDNDDNGNDDDDYDDNDDDYNHDNDDGYEGDDAEGDEDEDEDKEGGC
jgi:hypothetical protein